jgi:hypothetical protein
MVSATGKLSNSWLSPWVVAPETRDALILAMFCGLLFLKVCTGPNSPQERAPARGLESLLGARLLEPFWIALSLALPLFYIYFRTLRVGCPRGQRKAPGSVAVVPWQYQ